MDESVPQQKFLRLAMAELGRLAGLERPLTRDEMCRRLGCSRPGLDKWLLPTQNGKLVREMPLTLWTHVRDVVENESLKAALRQLGVDTSLPLGDGPLFKRPHIASGGSELQGPPRDVTP